MRPLVLALVLVVVACSDSAAPPTSVPATATRPTATTTTMVPATTATTSTVASTTTTTTTPPTTEPAASPFARPDWLGTRLLPLQPGSEFGVVLPTPPELIDRRFETLDLLPPPASDEFEFSLTAVPPDVLARSTWEPGCPVALDDLRYVTVSHYGFDGEFHTGELIVNAEVAEQLVGVFRQLHAARFPIEQMRVVRADELDAPPTGDGNDTTSFVCRPAVGSTTWSQHAFGLAVDINPFHNPYRKGDLVLPELASAYLDRGDVRPGMIVEGDAVTAAFDALGWGWGGRWSSLDDWMHFSRSGN